MASDLLKQPTPRCPQRLPAAAGAWERDRATLRQPGACSHHGAALPDPNPGAAMAEGEEPPAAPRARQQQGGGDPGPNP